MSRRRRNLEEDTVVIEAPERPDELPAEEPEPTPEADPTEPLAEPVEEAVAGEVLDDEEKVARFADPRRAVVTIVEKRLERMLQPIDEDEVWHGVQVITRRDLGEALMAPLPPASIFAASVRTPAFIYVDAVCPVCGIPTEIPLEVEAKLVATAHGRKIQLTAKATADPHQCGQQRLRDVTPTRPVKGQTTFALGGEGELEEDDEDVRPVGEVNADERRGAAANDVLEAERSTDGADDDEPDVLPF